MRWSSLFAAVLLAAVCVLFVQPSAYSADSRSWQAEVSTQLRPAPPGLAALRARLTPDDPVAVLQAVGYALDEVADGSTYIWHRTDGALKGAVHPKLSFHDATGAICRRLNVTLTLGEVTRWADVIACRDGDGRWVLGG